MKTRPILMSTENVASTLSGDKTQTRRTSGLRKLNRKPDQFRPTGQEIWYFDGQPYFEFEDVDTGHIYHINSKYGRPGDHLWLREGYYAVGYWEEDGLTKTGKPKYRFVDRTLSDGHQYIYQADKTIERPEKQFSRVVGWYKRNSIFMPKEASRITLEVTDIKVERLKDISEEDALAEGVGHGFQMNGGWPDYLNMANGVCDLTQDTAVMSFASLWESINGKGSWERNPWVWKVVFKKID